MEDSPIGKTIKRLISASEEDAKDWLKQGDEIEKYCTSNDYGFLYQDFDADLSFKARVNKASEFTQILGPYMYPTNPDASVTSEPWSDTWAKRRHEIEERYADYAAKHGRLDVDMRRGIDHALIYGRAPLWCGFDTKKKIVRHVFDRVSNYGVDPDARVIEERNYEWRKRIKSRWELIALYPDSKAIIERLPAYTKPKSDESLKRNADSTNELVCYYEVWFGVNASNYIPSTEVIGMDGVEAQAEMKFCVADGHVLHKGEWEIPFFLIDEWPSTSLDLLEMPGRLYPKQPMEPGMGHLRAMNWLYTLFLAKTRLMTRTPFARLTINGQTIEADQMHKILRGEQMDILNVCINGTDLENVDINKYFQRIDWGDPVPGFERAYALAGGEFDKSTGLAEVLYSGQTSTQIRNAATANLIESNSKSRIEAMRETTLKFLGRIFRKTLFAARYLHDAEDITTLFGKQAGQLWGVLGDPQAVAQEQAIRDELMANATSVPDPMTGVPLMPEQVEDMMGPPQFVSMDTWMNEADRAIDGGSMIRNDHDAKVNSMNVAMNQLGPAVVNLPGGGEYVAALAKEFSKINRLSPELQAAADKLAGAIQQAQMAMMAPPTQSAPTPAGGPAGDPGGGTPTVQ